MWAPFAEVDSMDPVRLNVRTRPGALLVTMVTAILTLVPSTGATAASWSTQERIASDPPLAMTVDDLGHTHVITADGNTLRYRTDASGRWTGRTITTFGSQAAIALSAGKVYVVFNRVYDCPADEQGCRTDPNQGLYLATDRSGTWRTQRLSGTRPAYHPSLRMRNGKLHIAYNDLKGIRYLTNASGAWSNHRVWSAGTRLTSSATTSIALDTSGPPSIAFMRTRCSGRANFGWCPRGDTVLRGVSLADRVGARWSISTITSGAGVLDRVAISKDGWPLVGYMTGSGSKLRFRLCEVIDGDVMAYRTLPGTGTGTFALDASGRVELVRWSGGTLTWRAERASGWLSRTWSAPEVSVAWIRSYGGVSVIVRDGFSSVAHAYSTWVLTRD